MSDMVYHYLLDPVILPVTFDLFCSIDRGFFLCIELCNVNVLCGGNIEKTYDGLGEPVGAD
jgi:hypothetical protein